MLVVVVPRLVAATAGGSTMATKDDPEELDDDDSDGEDEEARVVMSTMEGEGRGFLVAEKPKAVRSTIFLAPPGRLVEELLLFRLLMLGDCT